MEEKKKFDVVLNVSLMSKNKKEAMDKIRQIARIINTLDEGNQVGIAEMWEVKDK